MKNLFVFIFTISNSLLFAQNIGIGTTTPLELLHVKGGNLLMDGIGMVKFNSGGSFIDGWNNNLDLNGSEKVRINSNTSQSIQFLTAGVEYARFDSPTLSLGIGTKTPATKLDVNGATRSLEYQLINGTSKIYSQANGSFVAESQGNIILNAGSTGGGNGTIGFQDEGVTYSVFKDGKMGMGTLTPDESIHTTGAIKLGSALGTSLGTIQWNGSDFQGRTSNGWESLLLSNQIKDADSDTEITLQESPNESIKVTLEGSVFMEFENDTDGGHIINYFPKIGGTYEKITQNYRDGVTNYGSIGINEASGYFMTIAGKDRVFLKGNNDSGSNSINVSIGDHSNTYGMIVNQGSSPAGGVRSLLDVKGELTCDKATITDVMNLTPMVKPNNATSSVGDIYLDDGTCGSCASTLTLRVYNGSNWINL